MLQAIWNDYAPLLLLGGGGRSRGRRQGADYAQQGYDPSRDHGGHHGGET